MFTIKIVTDGNERIIPAIGEVTVLSEGTDAFKSMITELQSHGADATGCRAVLDYQRDSNSSVTYLYDNDRAYIMNDNGKTVATV